MDSLRAHETVFPGSVAPDHAAEFTEQNEGLKISARHLKSAERFGHAYHRFLVVADAVAITIAVGIAYAAAVLLGVHENAVTWVATVVLLLPVWILIAYQSGLYGQVERRLSFDYVTEFPSTVVAVTIWAWILLIVGSITAGDGPNVFGPVAVWLASIPLLLICRATARAIARTRPWFTRSVALIGDSSAIELIGRRIERHPEWGIEVGLRLTRHSDEAWEMHGKVAGLEDHPEELDPAESEPAGMTRLITRAGIDRVIIAGGSGDLNSRIELAHTMLYRDVAVDFVAGGPETFYGTSITQHLEGMTLMSSRPSYPGPLGRALKRTVDVILSGLLLILSVPILLVAAVRIKRDSPGPVFFRQTRSGLNEEEFELVKLRTMYEGADEKRQELREATREEGNDDVLFKLEVDPRVTRIGHRLRRTSLDEIPQLWNVFKGDMSMVGPRPLVPEEAELASGMYTARFKLKPGIAGPWQAEGRSDIPFEDMLRLDYSYVAGWSMVEDLKLLLRTFSAVILRRGAK